jgi:hypothetical protein
MLAFFLLKRGAQADERAIYRLCLLAEFGQQPPTEEQKFLSMAICCARHIAGCEQLGWIETECSGVFGSNSSAQQEDKVSNICEIFCANLDERFQWCPSANTLDVPDSPLLLQSDVCHPTPDIDQSKPSVDSDIQQSKVFTVSRVQLSMLFTISYIQLSMLLAVSHVQLSKIFTLSQIQQSTLFTISPTQPSMLLTVSHVQLSKVFTLSQIQQSALFTISPRRAQIVHRIHGGKLLLLLLYYYLPPRRERPGVARPP